MLHPAARGDEEDDGELLTLFVGCCVIDLMCYFMNCAWLFITKINLCMIDIVVITVASFVHILTYCRSESQIQLFLGDLLVQE